MMKVNLVSLRGDVYGGITAAVVALPLALAFGVASGTGAIAGLYGAIATGFFAAVFGGTRAQVSGPTGPMTVVMAAVVAQHANNLAEAFTIVLLGGAFQVVLGILRVGRYVSYTPYSVVSGFMSGIGVIIILIQTLPFFGLPTAGGGPVGAVLAWSRVPGAFNVDALTIAVISLGVIVFWPKRLRAVLPPPLAALILGTLLGLVVFKTAPVIGDVPTGLPEIVVPVLSIKTLPAMIQPALILALLGSIDSLLTSLVADSITRTRHNSNRELIGQGIGNMVAGLIGGLPGAGATMRTVVNVRAGGSTPASGALHAFILLALVLGLGPLAEQVPHAVLAGILMKVGWDIIDWGFLKRIKRAPLDKVVVMLVTLGLTVFVDLITAVAVGLILAGFVTSRWMEKEQLAGVTMLAIPEGPSPMSEAEREVLRLADGKVGVVVLRGAFSYASARELVQRVGTEAAGYRAVVFDFSEASHMDLSAALAMEELIDAVGNHADGVYLSGLSGAALRTLDGLGVLGKVSPNHVFVSRVDAVKAAAQVLSDAGKTAAGGLSDVKGNPPGGGIPAGS